MSEIIIEGKNLDDLNQSNFQTVGVRSSFYFKPNLPIGGYDPSAYINSINIGQNPETDNFVFDTISGFANRYGQSLEDLDVFNFFKLLRNTTVEPWQGRLHYDKEIEDSITPDDPNFDSEQYFNFFKEFGSNLQYPFFYLGDVYDDNLRYNINDKFNRIENNNLLGVDKRFDDNNEPKVYLVKDDRFPLGTYTENNKQFWELQTSDVRTRKSQFTRPKMRTAFAKPMNEDADEIVITSDEERFSVDAFVFTEREGKSTPLCFYYDEQLHNQRYNLASTGKVFMQIELRESGRDTLNNIDLYQERIPYRPFRLGFAKEEQGGGIGDVYGEGLYNINDRVILDVLPSEESYSLGIFDDNGELKSTEERYVFIMPAEDVSYEARFRKNPKIRILSRFTRPDGTTQAGNSESENTKGVTRIFSSQNNTDGTTVPIGDVPNFGNVGQTMGGYMFKPTEYGGTQYTVEQQRVTNDYSFDGFTYISSSEGGFVETEFPTIQNTDSQQPDQKSFNLKEHFRYPLLSEERTLVIYANYSTGVFILTNFNNSIDFENGGFDDAIQYGPLKYAIQREFASSDITYDGTSEYDLFESNDSVLRLLTKIPDTNLNVNPIDNGYEFGRFFALDENNNFINLSEPLELPIENTFANAVELNNGEAPPESVSGNEYSSGYSVGATFGTGDVFILTDIQYDEGSSDPDGPHYYDLTWAPNITTQTQVVESRFNLTDGEISDGFEGIKLFGDVAEDGLLLPNGITTPIIGFQSTTEIRYQPFQLGTYVKCTLASGQSTSFTATNVGADEIVRPIEDSGAINANMFGFGEQVRFQLDPDGFEADEPTYSVFVYHENEEGLPTGTMKNINDDDINLTKEQFGVTFEWNAGGNFGTIDYNVPASRNSTFGFDSIPIYFKYVEFRFTVVEEEGF